MAEKMHFNMQFCVTAQNVRITFLFRFANGELGFEIDWIGRTNKTEQKKMSVLLAAQLLRCSVRLLLDRDKTY